MADYARAERLRELRHARHLSQEAVAAEIGVSVKSLRSWEKGGKIRWENAKRIAIFYNVDAEPLVAREAYELPEVEPSQLDQIEAKLDAVLTLLHADDLEAAVADVEAAPVPAGRQRATAAASARAKGRQRGAS